jgi:hypothetical protein
MRLDPRTVRADATPEGTPSEEKVVATFGRPPRSKNAGDAGAARAPEKTDRKLFLGGHVFSIAKSAAAGSIALAEVATHAPDARAAVGISDEDGMLQWIELMPDDRGDAATADEMLKLLERIGCSARGLVTSDVRAYPGGAMDIGAEPAAPVQVAARLVRTAAPAARLTFENTEIVPQSVWQPLQSQKVKWRPTLAPPEKPAASASASASAKPPPAPPK